MTVTRHSGPSLYWSSLKLFTNKVTKEHRGIPYCLGAPYWNRIDQTDASWLNYYIPARYPRHWHAIDEFYYDPFSEHNNINHSGLPSDRAFGSQKRGIIGRPTTWGSHHQKLNSMRVGLCADGHSTAALGYINMGWTQDENVFNDS